MGGHFLSRLALQWQTKEGVAVLRVATYHGNLVSRMVLKFILAPLPFLKARTPRVCLSQFRIYVAQTSKSPQI